MGRRVTRLPGTHVGTAAESGVQRPETVAPPEGDAPAVALKCLSGQVVHPQTKLR